jgi:hypothetical protein
MKFVAWFAVIVGTLMLAMWTFFLVTGQVPELVTEPYRIALHLAGEFATAIALIIAGIGLLNKVVWGRSLYFVAAGMLLYTLIVSPGYYAQQRQWAFVGMFALLLLLDLLSVFKLYASPPPEKASPREGGGREGGLGAG